MIKEDRGGALASIAVHKGWTVLLLWRPRTWPSLVVISTLITGSYRPPKVSWDWLTSSSTCVDTVSVVWSAQSTRLQVNVTNAPRCSTMLGVNVF